LQPPLLGNNSVDQFLFETRRGFCEHYASAFVFLMRAAGIPARVVAGYQGGEINPVDGYVVVRQSDAHAWAEIWIAGRGWQRVDPTAAIAPSRVEQGIAAALPEGETLPVMARVDLDWLRQMRYRWEAINNNWNQWVLGYNPERQREVLSRFGLGNIDWRGMTVLLSALCALALLGITIWTLWQRPRVDPAQKIWLRFCARLAGQGIPRQPWEGPIAYAERVAVARPEYGGIAHQAATAYAAVRYGEANEHRLQRLREALRQIPNTWRFF
ncbi:MAG: protein-glutamine gamma-glutamyltransferase, partial [Pseudomonadota bacterium]|nr:protein-glutamine gamma-glutamyltransferase [Pseudomonadota bacterium]